MQNDNRAPRIIETASATTSSDNSNSGPFAYIITAVALGLLILFSVAGGGCASLMFQEIAEDYRSGSSTLPHGYDWNYDDLQDMDWDDILQYYSDDNSNGHQDTSTSATVADVLDYDIAPYGATIDSELSASSYAGAPSEVRDFVRELVQADKTQTSALVVLLNFAALNEDTRAQSIQEAIDLCEQAKEQMNGFELPALSADNNGAVRDTLGSAKGKAVDRWSYLADEIRMLDTTEDIDTKQLWSIDGNALEATTAAADLLQEAMSQAADQ